MRHLIAALIGLIVLMPAFSARAETRALVALKVNGENSFAAALAVHDALNERHGFDHVEMVTDATPEEIFDRVKAFLERPGAPGDRRFVWVSGRTGRHNQGLCPEKQPGSAMIRPRVTAIVLAPDCLAAAVKLPRAALTIQRSNPTPERIARYFAYNATPVGPGLAVLPLPGHSPEAVAEGDRAVLSALHGAQGVGLRPLGLLSALRLRFRGGYGPYQPRLNLADWRAPFRLDLPQSADGNPVQGNRG